MKHIKNSLKNLKKDKRKISTIVMISLLIILAFIVGIKRIQFSDFNPINGDFQNYNPVRRFLTGQIPFKDFSVYLGIGHMLTFSFMQLILGIFFGNNFTTSLLVTNMTTFMAFELTVFLISYFILKNKKGAFLTTLIFAMVNIIRPQFIINNLDALFVSALNFGLEPGLSARLIRVIIAPLATILLLVMFKKTNNLKSQKIKNVNLLRKALFAIIGGACIAWSNDGGIATYISVSFVFFLFLIKEHQKNIKAIVKDVLIYIGISLLSFFAVLLIVTRGHILSWFNFTFQISSYQKWYYYEAPDKLNISLLDIDLNIYNVLLGVIAVYYIYRFFKTKDKKSYINYAMLLIIILSSIISCYLYQFLSGGTSKDMIMLLLMIIFFSYVVKIVYQMLANNENKTIIVKSLKVATIICAVAVIINNTGTIISNIRERKAKVWNNNAVYIKELGGYFSEYGKSIQKVIKNLGDKKLFSTYATAIETATNQFHPTGFDYIIHCMGDKQREEYLKVFNEGNFDYVTTVDKQNVPVSKWILNANWFFYRELYQHYKPVFSTDYNVFWEKTNEDLTTHEKAKLTYEKVNDHTYNITVTTDDKSFSGLADIKLAYNTKFKKSFFKNLNINKYVYVKDITGKTILNDKTEMINYNIPDSKEEYYIPITIINGVGKIQITSYPLANSKLNIENIELLNIYNGLLKYGLLSKDKKISNNTLYVDYNDENKILFENVKKIKINDIEEEVLKYKVNGNYIELQVAKNADKFAYPNYFEIIKN